MPRTEVALDECRATLAAMSNQLNTGCGPARRAVYEGKASRYEQFGGQTGALIAAQLRAKLATLTDEQLGAMSSAQLEGFFHISIEVESVDAARRDLNRGYKAERHAATIGMAGELRMLTASRKAAAQGGRTSPIARPRERRPVSRRRSHSPPGRRSSADDGDPEPPPRSCAVCGGSLTGKRRHAQTCGPRCRVAKHRHAALTAAERAALERRYETALRLVKSLTPEQRPLLLAAVVWPTDVRLSASHLRKVA
jgi:hypothetical protein